MKKAFYLALLILAAGCAATKNKNLPYNGTWILIQKSGGFAGMTTKPENEVRLVIKKDKIKTFGDGKLIFEDTFKIEKGKVIQSAEPQDIIVSTKLMKQMISVSGDTLTIADQCYDCFSYLYVKMK